MTVAGTQVAQYSRYDRLSAELSYAVKQVDGAQLAAWAGLSAKHFGSCLVRRVGNVTTLLVNVAAGTLNFAANSLRAKQEERLAVFLQESAGRAARTATDAASSAVSVASAIRRQLSSNPSEAIPHLLMTVTASLLVSGGPDADGGAPDLDLMFGIGAHRSILSHSIVMGSALEAGVMSLLALVDLVHDKLPPVHDGVWDRLHSQSAVLASGFKTGAALGMAYHLFADGTLQAAPYHDLPISAPMPVHEGIFVANAFAEASSAGQPTGRAKERTAPSRSERAAPQAPQVRRRQSTASGAFETGKAAAARHGKASVLAHKAYLAVDLVVEPTIARLMTNDDLKLVRRYGVWLDALVDGELEPRTLEQHDFIAVARKQASAQTPYERAWLAYLDARWTAEYS